METEDRGRCCSCCGCYGDCCQKRHRRIGRRGKKCAIRFSRLCLIIPNILFVLGGICLTAFGVWIRIDPDSVLHLELLRHLPTAGPLIALERFPLVVICVGCSVAILSLIGCCGACAENSCCLCLYAFFLVLVLTADIIFVVLGFAMREQIIVSLGNSMQQQIVTNYNSSSVDRTTTATEDRTFSRYFTRSWDTIQMKFNCCGSFGPEDYQSSGWFNRTRLVDRETFVPASCCHLAANRQDHHEPPVASLRLKQCQKDAFLFIFHPSTWDSTSERRTSPLKTQGCQNFIFNITQRNVSIVTGIICALVILQIADFIFACALLRYVRRRQDEIWFGTDESAT